MAVGSTMLTVPMAMPILRHLKTPFFKDA